MQVSKSDLRILFDLHRDRDQQFLQNQLGDTYSYLTLEEIDEKDPDIIIADLKSYLEHKSAIHSLIEERHPLITPLLLLVKEQNISELPDSVWEDCDDILQIPTSPKVLQAKVKSMVRTHKLSYGLLETKEKLQQQNEDIRQHNQKLSLYRQAINSSNVGMVLSKREGDQDPIIDCNQKFLEMSGYELHEVIGEDCRFLQGSDRDQEARKRIRDCINNGEECEEVIRNYTKSGQFFWNKLHIAPITDQEGTVTHYVGIQHDITREVNLQQNLLKSEKKWSQLVENSPVLVVILNKNLEPEYINPSGREILEIDKDRSVDDLSINNFMDMEFYQDKILERFEKLGQGKATDPFIYEVQTNVDTRKKILASSTFIEYKDEEMIQVVGVDITKRSRYEEKLKEALREKRVMLEEIHHRVKNNMAVVSGLLDLQMDQIENAEAKEALTKSQTRLQSMAKVHEKLYQSEDLNRIKFCEYVDELIDGIVSTLQAPDLEIETQYDDLELDINQAIPIGLIINELISNAIKHGFENGTTPGTISVSLTRQQRQVTLKVQDDGSGLPEDFDSHNNQRSLGMTLINRLTTQIDGRWELKDEGWTTAEVVFPLSDSK